MNVLKFAAALNSGFDPNAWDISKIGSTPSLAWNVTKCVPIQIFSVATQETNPQDLFFKPDGTKLYVLGASGDDVNEYTLSTAWDISTATYVQNFSVASQEAGPTGIFFKSDGTKMYVCGTVNDNVNEYDLSSAWDISTASYVQNFSVATQELQPQSLSFKPDGTKMYVLGLDGDDVNEYALSSAWDVSTATYSQNFSVATQETTPQGIFFRSDGTKMYVLGVSSLAVNEYDLSSAWDVSTASYVQKFSVNDTTPTGIFFKDNGSRMYVLGAGSDRVTSYIFANTFSVSTQEALPEDLFFKPDGTKLYVIGSLGDEVNEYTLSTPWSITSASYVQTFDVSVEETAPTGIFFKPDGTKMYVLGRSGDDVNEYTLSSAWDISTASYVQNFSVATQEVTPQSLSFKPDGTKMYVLGSSGDDVNEYTLSTAWNISTASYVQNFSVSSQETLPYGIYFKDDGTTMYVSGANINEYSLSTPWNISTASYVRKYLLQTTNNGIYFKSDGTKVFVAGDQSVRELLLNGN